MWVRGSFTDCGELQRAVVLLGGSHRSPGKPIESRRAIELNPTRSGLCCARHVRAEVRTLPLALLGGFAGGACGFDPG
jgi:hypothetical protein